MSFLDSVCGAIGLQLQPVRCENPSASSAPPVSKPFRQKILTPDVKTMGWFRRTTPKREHEAAGISHIKDGRIQKPSSTRNSQKPRRSLFQNIISYSPWSPYTTHSLPCTSETTEYIKSTAIVDSIPDSPTRQYLEGNSTLPSLKYHEGGTTIIQNPNGNLIPEKPTPDSSPIDFFSWTPEELQLWTTLNRRGQDPLIDYTWHMDFPTCPPEVFETDLTHRAFIGSTQPSGEYRASRALLRLFGAGGNVRARLLSGLDPTPTLTKEVQAYFDWSVQDIEMNGVPHLPVLDICQAGKYETPTSTIKRVADRMRESSRVWRKLQDTKERGNHQGAPASGSNNEHQAISPFDTLPTLYCIMVTHSVAAFFTLNAAQPDTEMRSLGTWDFQKNANDDVWHALSIAILIVSAREDLRALAEEGWFEKFRPLRHKGKEVEEEDDPDL